MGESIFALALIDMESVSSNARRLLLEGRRLLGPAATNRDIDISDSNTWSAVLAICLAYVLIMLVTIYKLQYTFSCNNVRVVPHVS